MKFAQKSKFDVPDEIFAIITNAIKEDIGPGDITTNSIIAEDAMMKGKIIAKQWGVIAGLDIAGATFHEVDSSIKFSCLVKDGSQVDKFTELAEVNGRARALLTAERTALNFLGRMSGIATLTKKFVEAVNGTKAIILDTRKTAPGLRVIDKLAVLHGGGENHRMGLFDMVLIKDNHIDHIGSIEKALQCIREKTLECEIEVETRTITDVQIAIDYGIPRILLDNMPPSLMKQAVELCAGRAKLEASGNVTLETVREIAETGVDYISIGALTHSVKNFDLSLEWEKS